MTTHSSILAWRIPWTEEPGGLQSMGSQRIGHGRSDFTHTHTQILVFNMAARSYHAHALFVPHSSST